MNRIDVIDGQVIEASEQAAAPLGLSPFMSLA